MDVILAYLLLGSVAGVLAGLLGVGGGIVIVPALFFLYQQQGFDPALVMHLAIGTSLATVVVTSVASTWAHHKRQAVLWFVVLGLVPGILAGGLLGSAVADILPGDILRTCFGLFELLVAFQLGIGLKPAAHRDLPGKAALLGVGLIIGTISTVLGIGGGTLTVPFLLWCNVVIRNAVASSAAVGLPIALAGSAGFAWVGSGAANLPEWSTGYIYWPAVIGVAIASAVFAPLGAKLAHTISLTMLQRVFAIVLAIVGVRMLF